MANRRIKDLTSVGFAEVDRRPRHTIKNKDEKHLKEQQTCNIDLFHRSASCVYS